MHDMMTSFADIADVTDFPLFRAFKGQVIRPEDAAYDRLRALATSNRDDRPALLLRVADAADVATGLAFARSRGLEVAIRSGGHSTASHSSVAGGVVIDLRDLSSLEIAEDRGSVWAGAGLTAGEVTRALEPLGLVVGFGDAASVGIGGLTLGGGIGYLVRKHGLTIDQLIAVEMVTAAGELVIADETRHPELFWALRGGGGNFGVVTRFRFRLHPLPEFTGGPMVFPATPEIYAGLVAAAAAAPEALSVIIQALPAPPLPFVPPEAVGQTVILALVAFAGPDAAAAEALAPLRAVARPLADLVGSMPYSAMYLPEESGPGPAVSVRSAFIDRFGPAEAAKLLALLAQNAAPMRLAQIRVLGGATARVPQGATAFAHRDAPLMLTFMALDAPDGLARNEAWAECSLRSMRQDRSGVYVNFLAEEDRLHEAYPAATWDRLRAVKRAYDPQNLFRRNQNIPPAEA